MHEEDFLSSWLREVAEGKAEELEKVNREAQEEYCKSGNRMFGSEKEGLAVVCERACCECPSSMNERVLGKGLEEEVVDLLGEESEHWCEVTVYVPVSVFLVLGLISPVNVVCGVGFCF